MRKVVRSTALVVIGCLFAAMQCWAGQVEVVKPEKAGMSAKTLSLVDEFVQDGIKAKYYKGAVVLVARHGKVCYFKSYGESKKDTPMKTDAIFRQASMTKPVTTVALMQFYDKGAFKLDDPLSKYLPEFKNLQVAQDDGKGNITLVPAKREVTMHDLLSYSAGFSATFYHGANPATNFVTECYVAKGVEDLFNSNYTTTLKNNVMGMAKCPLAYQPGEGWQYAHASQDIIGYLVEKFSGMPLDKYVEKEIFQPLKMSESWWYPPPSEFSRIPEVTVKNESGTRFTEHKLGLLLEDQEYSFGKNKSYLAAGAGLHSTAYDYFRFAQMLLNKGELDGVRVVSRKSVELMTQPTAEKNKISGLTGNLWGYAVDVQAAELPGGSGYWLGGKGSYGWRGIWSTLWNNNPTDDTVVIMETQVADDGAFPYLYLINTITSSAVIN
jgi:CubicO group peptidase (beta-lactamase class C family)